MAALTGADVGLNPGAKETIDMNGACSLGHLGCGFRRRSISHAIPCVGGDDRMSVFLDGM